MVCQPTIQLHTSQVFNITMVTASLPVAKVAVLFVGMSSCDISVSLVVVAMDTSINN